MEVEEVIYGDLKCGGNVHYKEDDAIICKFQRPLFSSADNYDEVLVYNEDRDFTMIVPMDEEAMEEIFPDEEEKTYWLCVPDKNNYLHPIKRVEEQEW